MFKQALIFIFFLFSANFGTAQTKKVVIVDSLSRQPISNVSIFNPITKEGVVTNTEGATLLKEGKIFIVSHVSYYKETIPYSMLKDTILLKPRIISLNELVIYSSTFNLKKLFKNIYRNHKDLYITGSYVFKCHFEESVKIDENLTRLSSSELKLYCQNYESDVNKSYTDQDYIELLNVNYAKNLHMGDFNVEKNAFFKHFHINFIAFVYYRKLKNLEILLEERYKNIIRIKFTGNIKAKKQIGEIHYDVNTMAIVRIVHSTQYKELGSWHTIELSFNECQNNKYCPNFFKLERSAIKEDKVVTFNKELTILQTQKEVISEGTHTSIEEQNIIKRIYSSGDVEDINSKIILTEKKRQFLEK